MKEKSRMVNIAIPEHLLARIEDYRFEQRFSTRAEAMRFLLKWALEQNPNKK